VDLRLTAKPFEPNWDQGSLGSCGPHSACLNLVYDMLATGTPAVMPSRLFAYYTTRQVMGTTGYDSGVDNRSMFKALAKYGWCDESLIPYQIGNFRDQPSGAAYAQAVTRRITEYLSVPQSLTQMKACLAGDGTNPGRPFVFGFTVYDSFFSNATEQTGIVSMPSGGVAGGHDILFVGYDDDKQMFIFKNSWGEEWGDFGDGFFPYSYATSPNLAGDFWTARGSGIAPPAPPAPVPPTPPVPVPGKTYAIKGGTINTETGTLIATFE